MGIVYRITNIKNGKVYIGKTDGRLELRWTRHRRDARAGIRSRFYNAIRKYGTDAFVIEQIGGSMLASATNRIECEFIASYDSMNPDKGYNMTPGGDGAGSGPTHPSFGKPGKNKGRKFPQEFRDKARARQVGKHPSLTTRQKTARTLLGTVRSDKFKVKQSSAKSGSMNPMFGKTFTDEHRKNLSIAQQARREREKNGR